LKCTALARWEFEMDIITVVLCLVGIAMVAGLSAAVYGSLPKVLSESATRHGRFQGLGIEEPRDKPVGNTPVGHVGSLPVTAIGSLQPQQA
jgi:hypothetical protein